ncbi:MAG: cytochrome c peroxidase [Blastocatellia bacterium]
MKRISTIKLVVLGILGLVLPGLVYAGDSSAESSSFEMRMPRGIARDLWLYFIPKENPMTAAKVELGRMLFFDQRLSVDGTVSCASCHDPMRAFTDGRTVAEGVGGRRGVRNSPTLLNAMFNTGQFWDGRAGSLEEQAKMPLTNADEMGNRSVEEVVSRIASIPAYSRAFQEVFGGPVSIDGFARAVAAFERTLVSGDAPIDAYLSGDAGALSADARSGLGLFRGRARCGVCHALNQNFGAFATFPFFTDGNYRNTGVAANFGGFNALARRAVAASRDEADKAFGELKRHERASELGRFVISGNTLDIGAFRTPSLRNIELTAPYFHDGSAATLGDVVRYYVKGGNDNPNRDWQLEAVPLTEDEQHDLVEFLKALTSNDARRAPERR